ncbi:MAG: Inner membrane protein YnjF [Candidatus Anoxychlamydiales bacterium]|nr:Inner membrane protein YnjF [Candidatus Anoxychlamydiales bacterium]
MLDSNLYIPYQKILINPILKLKILKHLHPNLITLFSCLFGIFSFFLIILNHKYLAISSLLLSGYFDTLDGSIARLTNQKSNLGSVLDIFSDRIVEMLIFIALFLVDPQSRAFFTILMLASSYLCVTSFLVVGIFSQNDGKKSFHYSSGIIERAEAFIFFIAMIFFEKFFKILALSYSTLVFLTAFIRIFEFMKNSYSNKLQ